MVLTNRTWFSGHQAAMEGRINGWSTWNRKNNGKLSHSFGPTSITLNLPNLDLSFECSWRKLLPPSAAQHFSTFRRRHWHRNIAVSPRKWFAYCSKWPDSMRQARYSSTKLIRYVRGVVRSPNTKHRDAWNRSCSCKWMVLVVMRPQKWSWCWPPRISHG